MSFKSFILHDLDMVFLWSKPPSGRIPSKPLISNDLDCEKREVERENTEKAG